MTNTAGSTWSKAVTLTVVPSGYDGAYATWKLSSSGLMTIIEGYSHIYDPYQYDNRPWVPYLDQIKRAVISDGLTCIDPGVFYGCRNLTSVTIPDIVTVIGICSFYGCSSLTSVTIPGGVTDIGYKAFYGCSSLTSIAIPASVTSIGASPFSACESLAKITVSSENTYYCSYNGVLFNKDKTELIQYPAGKSGSSYTIPSTVTSIGDYAFYDCDALTSVTIGKGVTSIGDGAFDYCSSLTDVYYKGTKTQWSKIEIGD